MLATDLGVFCVFFVLSALVRRRFRHHSYSATAAGGIVMATGIFTAAALPHLPFHTPMLGRLLTIEIFILWLFLAWSYLLSAVNRHFRMHYAHPLRRFAFGTWVAGTAVLAMLAVQNLPEAPLIGRLLALLAVALYLPYVVLFVLGYVRLWRHPLTQRANGVVLLATVSTQSIVLALHAAFGTALPAELALGMIAFDLIFLCSGLLFIALHYLMARNWLLAIEWKNANCIIHGAVSITGLALVLVSPLQVGVLIRIWGVALALFVAVEVIEFVRMVEREHRRGLRSGLLVYDVTQWTRNFTYGMFYAFSAALDQRITGPLSAQHDLWHDALGLVTDYGQYIVLVFLLIESFIFFRARIRF